MADGVSNGQVTDDVKWPWTVKFVIPIRLERNISKRKDLETPFQRTTNRKLPMGIKWSRDRWRHMTSKGAVRQNGRLS